MTPTGNQNELSCQIYFEILSFRLEQQIGTQTASFINHNHDDDDDDIDWTRATDANFFCYSFFCRLSVILSVVSEQLTSC